MADSFLPWDGKSGSLSRGCPFVVRRACSTASLANLQSGLILFPLQNQNNLVLTVQTNDPDGNGVQSNKYYNSYSLLKSLEAAFGLPCLNHACDPGTSVMSDLFGGDSH